jgi:hypothetical protein
MTFMTVPAKTAGWPLPALEPAGEILVASFNDIYWYSPADGGVRPVHAGEGRYYGIAAGPTAETLYAISRPDQQKKDLLLQIDAAGDGTRARHALDSQDTHQMIRHGAALWVTDTFVGRLLEYHIVPELSPGRVFAHFTHADHVNSVRIGHDGIYLLCHGFGISRIVRMHSISGDIERVYSDTGREAHDLAPCDEGFAVCDSGHGGLAVFDRESGAFRTVWAEEGAWTKGLLVTGRTAYFGISRPTPREDRYKTPCDLAAVDLNSQKLLWRRPLPRPGLVNFLTSQRTLELERDGVPA